MFIIRVKSEVFEELKVTALKSVQAIQHLSYHS